MYFRLISGTYEIKEKEKFCHYKNCGIVKRFGHEKLFYLSVIISCVPLLCVCFSLHLSGCCFVWEQEVFMGLVPLPEVFSLKPTCRIVH